MSRRVSRTPESIRIRGRRYNIRDWLTVGGRKYGIIMRLSEARERYLVCDREGAPGGCLRALHFYEQSDASRQRLARVQQVKDSRLPMLAIYHEDSTRIAALFHWVDGVTLESLLDGVRRGEKSRPSSDVALQMIRNLVHAVRRVNDQLRVVHGDIKPANVIVPHRNVTNLTLIDFGSAWCVERSVHDAGAADGITRHVYAAPEQRRADSVPDFRADMFSLGVIAYELLTGTTPYAGMGGGAGATPECAREFVGTLERPSLHRSSQDWLTSAAWAALDKAVMGSLELDPARRFTGWGPLCRDLDLAHAELALGTRIGSGWERLFHWTARLGRSLGWSR